MRSFVICTAHPILFGDNIEKNEIGWAYSTYGVRRVVYRVLVGKPGEKRPLGRPRRRWEDNIKMDLQEVGGGMNGAGSGWGRVAGTCEYGNELSGSVNVGNFLTV
jgi:hypothetical protein